jgi:hypothetical protein
VADKVTEFSAKEERNDIFIKEEYYILDILVMLF